MPNYPQDLVVLVADGAIQQVVQTLLKTRQESLGIRSVGYEVVRDALHDSGSESKAVDLLRGYCRSHQYALLIRDLEGSGWEDEGAASMEQKFTAALEANGWHGRVATIVLEPEIEVWLRFDSPAFTGLIKGQARMRREDGDAEIKATAARHAQRTGGCTDINKPVRPKEVFESVLADYGVIRSNSLYGHLAERESLKVCQVPSFVRLKSQLTDWFASLRRQ